MDTGMNLTVMNNRIPFLREIAVNGHVGFIPRVKIERFFCVVEIGKNALQAHDMLIGAVHDPAAPGSNEEALELFQFVMESAPNQSTCPDTQAIVGSKINGSHFSCWGAQL